jgi:hypothetical protein
VCDVQNHVLVCPFAAHPRPERASLADADGEGGLTFERARPRTVRARKVGVRRACERFMIVLYRCVGDVPSGSSWAHLGPVRH